MNKLRKQTTLTTIFNETLCKIDRTGDVRTDASGISDGQGLRQREVQL